MVDEKGAKRKILEKLFKTLKSKHPKDSILKFDNNVVKEISGSNFSNQFDVTKCDTPELLPKCMTDKSFFIVHLGGGEHAFVKGAGYHKFETIKEIKKWKIAKSVIDDVSESEAQSASTAFSNKIIQDFLFGRTDADLVSHTARRARADYDFKVDGQPLKAKALQIEIDGIYESSNNETIATLEVKNKDNSYFEVRQLFSAMKYCEQKIPKNYMIRLLFLVRIRNGRDTFNLYEYRFKDKTELTSIKFVRAISYQIED